MKDSGACLPLPDPAQLTEELLKTLDVRLPDVLAKSRLKVDSKKKLIGRLKSKEKSNC